MLNLEGCNTYFGSKYCGNPKIKSPLLLGSSKAKVLNRTVEEKTLTIKDIPKDSSFPYIKLYAFTYNETSLS